jgi:hypothetical protein
MPAARITRRMMLLAALVGVVAVAMWPRGPRLVWYATKLMNRTGQKVQVGMMVPAGWSEDNRRMPGDPFVSACTIRPPVTRSRWLPGWLNDRLFGQPERISSVVVNPSNVLPDEKVHVARSKTQMGFSTIAFWSAGREIKQGGPFTLGYVRTNHAEFEATYLQICESFRVIH